MSGGRLFFRILLGLVLIGALVAGGIALFQAGYAQGYQTAILANAGPNGAAPGAPAYGYLPLWRGFGFPYFNPFGWMLGIGFFLFVFFMIGGLLRFGGRRTYGGGPGYWGHRPDPEFIKEWEEFYKGRAEKNKPANE